MNSVFQEVEIHFPKPKNFDEKNPQFDIFKNVAPNRCSKAEIKIFERVRIATNSVIFNYFKIVPESCVNHQNYQQYSKGFKFFLKFICPKINFSKKTFLVITDEWTSNYYHWHFFALKKLLALQEVEELKNAVLFLPKKYQKYPFVLPSLERFGITKNRIVFLPRKSNIKVAKAATAVISQQHVYAFQKMREILTKNCVNSEKKFGERIYISRQQQVLRSVENEEAVTKLLEKFGFKKIIAEQLSYQEQVQLFSQARYLVSPHGAGLSNILFMQDGSKVLEMACKPFKYKPITDYYKLAFMMNVDYFYQECEMAASSQVMDFHHANLVVDVKKLEENLKLMLRHE